MEKSLFSGSLVKTTRNIYTATNFAKNALFYLQEVGTLTAIKPHVSKRKNLHSYLLFIVLEGSGHLDYCGVHYTLVKGDCVFIDCKNEYSQSSSDNLWTLKWIHFYGKSMPEIYDKYVRRGGLSAFSLMDIKKYELGLDEIFDFSVSQDYIRDMKINQTISSLLTFLMEETRNLYHPVDGPISTKRNVDDIKKHIETNFAEKISLDMLAEKFYINKYYLTRIFKEQTGTSITNYLLEIRITQAKHQLRFTALPISEISNVCGFDDPSYFARAFHKYEGISPSAFRKSWNE